MMDGDELIVIGDEETGVGALAGAGAEAADAASAPQLPANARLNDDGSVTLTLGWPASIRFRAADGTVREEPIETELVLHRLRGGDLRAMMNAEGQNASLVLFNRSLRKGDARGPLIFDALDAEDASAALAVIGFFTKAGRMTGR